jgi:ubiquinone/menaquinone biosynthesis C-methylase UbiE
VTAGYEDRAAEGIRFVRTEFVVGDAAALPFADGHRRARIRLFLLLRATTREGRA